MSKLLVLIKTKKQYQNTNKRNNNNNKTNFIDKLLSTDTAEKLVGKSYFFGS